VKKSPVKAPIRFAALIVVGGLLLSGCAQAAHTKPGDTKSDQPSEITVSGPASPPSLPIARMIETGALKGTKIKFDKWQTADQLTAAVTEGDEFVAAPLTTGATLAQKGAGIQLLNVSAWAVMGLVTNDNSVKKLEDLAGKELHVAMQASAVDYTMQLILAQHGLTDKVKIVYVDPLSGPEQFLAGKIPNLVTVEPQITMMMKKSPGARSIVDFQKEWGKLTSTDQPLPTAGTFVNAQFAKKHPETVKAFRDAYAKAAKWVADNPQDAGKLAGEKLGLPAPIVSEAIPKISWEARPAAKARPAVDLYFKQLFDRWPESVGGKLPDDSFYLQ
jgi:NitT/TauT family transport system substrate-binding protein